MMGNSNTVSEEGNFKVVELGDTSTRGTLTSEKSTHQPNEFRAGWISKTQAIMEEQNVDTNPSEAKENQGEQIEDSLEVMHGYESDNKYDLSLPK